jgi:tRNA(adenine34) deaminase
MLNHMEYLAYALEEAEKAFQKGNLPVGAVLVDSGGRILGRAQNTMWTEGGYAYHAEIALILANQARLSEDPWTVTLYSSLEPCIMCLGAAIIGRVGRVVWAADDYWAGGTRSYNFGSNYLQAQRCELIPPSSQSLQRQSVELMATYLEERDPEKLHLVLGKQLGFRL